MLEEWKVVMVGKEINKILRNNLTESDVRVRRSFSGGARRSCQSL